MKILSIVPALLVLTVSAQAQTPYEKLVSRGPQWSWIWQYMGEPVSTPADLHVLDGFNHNTAAFRSVIAKGSFPVAYFSCSYERYRPDSKLWRQSDKGKKMSGWDELWPAPAAIKNHDSNLWKIYAGRLRVLQRKLHPVTGGKPECCGVEWDNVDLYSSIKLGMPEGLRFLRHLKKITEDHGFVFALKNSVEAVPHLPGVKLYINESGQQYFRSRNEPELFYYSKVGRKVPVLNVEYTRRRVRAYPFAYTIYYSSRTRINGKAQVIP